MLVFAIVLLGIALVVSLTLYGRRDRVTAARVREILRESGDESLIPDDLDGVLQRVQMRLEAESSDMSPRRALAALDQMSTGAVVADADGQIVLRNRVAAPYATGRHGDALVENVIQARLRDALLGAHTDEELRLYSPSRVLLVVGNPLIVEGELIGAIVLVDDISEQQRLDAVRRDFVANVSHELRTPVGAMSLLAETLEGEEDPEVIRTFLDRIQEETDRLARLIEDLLDLSRIEGGMGEHVGPVDLGALVTEAAAAVRSVAEHKGVELSVSVDSDSIVVGDRAQLMSATTNLFDNAVKYTDEGGSVSGRVVAHGEEIAIAVVDTGIGVPQRDVGRLFERFYRVDRGRSVQTGGTGLGLSIVRHVAVNHGGRVELTSQEGVGSTFSMILPISKSAGETNPQEDDVEADIDEAAP